MTVLKPLLFVCLFVGGGLRNTAQPMSSTAYPVNAGLSKTNSAVLAAEKSPCPPSRNAVAMTLGAKTSSVQKLPSSTNPNIAPPPAIGIPVSSVTPSTVTHNVATGLSPSAAAVHAQFGRISKYATKDTPRTLGVNCVVDFEKIYRYLSEIHKQGKECNLTPMGKTAAHATYTNSKHRPRWLCGKHSSQTNSH